MLSMFKSHTKDYYGKPISIMLKLSHIHYPVITRKLSRNYKKRSRYYEKIISRYYEKRSHNYEKTMS